MNDVIDWLRAAKEQDGSDLHLTVDKPPLIRIHGDLCELDIPPLSADETREIIIGLLTERQRAELEKNLELDFALNVDNVGRFRGNAHYNRGTLQAAFRLIAEQVPTMMELGHRPFLQTLCEEREGLILVTGVTGSGKSTTLASMVEYISRRRSGVIISIEDPIEYIFDHSRSIVKQRELGADTHSFSIALRQALRQDPDVILVSELRDLETLQTAVTAAETGHLVISTLHTIDAAKSLDRMIDVFPPDQQPQIIAQLANALKAVVSQRLLPAKEGEGRVIASEIMVMNHAVRAVLRSRKFEQIPGLMQIGTNEGMHTLDECLSDLVLEEKITLDEALIHARDAHTLESRLAPVKKKLFG
ncbi:MAG: PilT/PilU family type 4a pilus ATPase [Verrucomicrobiaceae bacterium]|nr:PilT/PilU family type 4a pilus ATPase [Verrucomicrobiaceae bacterium]